MPLNTETPRPENTPSSEASYSRGQVVDALREGYKSFQDSVDAKAGTASNEEKWAVENLKDALDQTIDRKDSAGKASPKDNIPVDFKSNETGENFTWEEGIRVEGLIKHLKEKESSLPDGDEKQRIGEILKILEAQSKSFAEAHGKPEDQIKGNATDTSLKARKDLEALYISKDLLRATGSQDGAWTLAEDSLLAARELTIPKAVRKTRLKTASPGDKQTPGSPATQPTPAERHYGVNIVNVEEAASKFALLEARKHVTEMMRAGKWWEVWRWPQKVGLRLMEGGFVNMYKDRLLREMHQNNSSFLNFADIGRSAAQLSEARVQGQTQFNAVLERFREGRLIAGESQQAAQGQLRAQILEGLIKPITTGEITNSDQVRERLANFVRDPQVAALFGAVSSDFGDRAEMFAADVLETGLRIKEDLQTHNQRLEDIDRQIDINFGYAHAGFMGESRDTVTRAVAWAKRRRDQNMVRGARTLGFVTGWILNPFTVGAGVSLATNGLLRSLGWGARAAAIPSVFAGGLSGAIVAGARRYYEVNQDRRTHNIERVLGEEIRAQPAPEGRLGRLFSRIAGNERRSDLEQFRVDVASAAQLLDGQGSELLTGSARRSIQELMKLDLSNGQQSNIDEVARRITEIEKRLDFSAQNRVDYIDFGSKVGTATIPAELSKAAAELKLTLRNAGMNETDLNSLLNQWGGRWEQRLTTDRKTQDARFQRYRLGQAAGSAAFGFITGVAGSLVGQELGTLIRRGMGAAVGTTVIEGGINRVFGTDIGEYGGFNTDTAQELFKNPTNIALANGSVLAVGVDHSATLFDSAGNKIPTPPIQLLENGRFVIAGDPNTLPADVKKTFLGWNYENPTHDPRYSIQDRIKSLVNRGQHETFTYGNMIIDMESGSNHQMSMTLFKGPNTPGIMIHGFAKPDGKIDFNSSFNGNALLKDTDWQAVNAELKNSGWDINSEKISGGEMISLVDKFFKNTPEQMKTMGVLETTNLPHGNQYDVLRPDVVARTGLHTHNELTFHASGFRNYPGEPGTLSANGQIKGGLIPSWGVNYPGFGVLPPQADPNLDQINAMLGSVGGRKLEWKDLVYIVRTSNGREIILPFGADSTVKMPQEFFHQLPDGSTEYTGIDRMGYGVIQTGPNGPIIPASQILNNPNFLSERGAFTERWLASEAFGGKPAVEALPPVELFHAGPPPAFELVPPPPPEIPPFIDTPFSPRHPLPPLESGFPPETIYPLYGQTENQEFKRNQERRYRIMNGTLAPTDDLDVNALLKSNVFAEDTPSSEHGLDILKDKLLKADNVYFVLPHHIGDSLAVLGYTNALIKKLDKLGSSATISLMVPDSMYHPLKSLGQGRLRVIPGGQIDPRRDIGTPAADADHTVKGIERSLNEIKADASAKNVFIFDFEHVSGGENEVKTLSALGKNITIATRLFNNTFSYGNAKDGQKRYVNFASELLKDADQSEGITFPEIKLPADHDTLYDNIVTRYSIDKTRPQVAIVLESGSAGRQYSVEQWTQAAKLIQDRHPEMQFNFIVNPNKDPDDPTLVDKTSLNNAISTAGLSSAKVINGNILELESLFEKQKLVLSNDGGMFHVASAIENGPKVIGLFFPGFTNHWVLNPNRSEGIEAPDGMGPWPDEWGKTNDAEKWINRIPPQRISDQAITQLRTAGV